MLEYLHYLCTNLNTPKSNEVFRNISMIKYGAFQDKKIPAICLR